MRLFSIGLFFLLTNTVLGKTPFRLNTTPVGEGFSYPSGMVFPGLNGAPLVNAAALTPLEKVTAIQGAFSATTNSADGTGAFGGLVLASPRAGIAVGVQRSELAGNSSLGGFAGLGASFEPMSIGFSLTDSDLDTGFSPKVDLGILVGEGRNRAGIAVGAVLYDVASAKRLGLGIGYRSPKNYHLEANAIMPNFPNSDSNYSLSLAGTIYSGAFGLVLRSQYATLSKTFTHTLGGVLWLGSYFNLIAQYSSPRKGTLGATLLF